MAQARFTGSILMRKRPDCHFGQRLVSHPLVDREAVARGMKYRSALSGSIERLAHYGLGISLAPMRFGSRDHDNVPIPVAPDHCRSGHRFAVQVSDGASVSFSHIRMEAAVRPSSRGIAYASQLMSHARTAIASELIARYSSRVTDATAGSKRSAAI